MDDTQSRQSKADEAARIRRMAEHPIASESVSRELIKIAQGLEKESREAL